LEAYGEGRLRAHAASDAAILFAGDGLVKLERVSPESLAPERVVAKDTTPVLHHLLRVFGDYTIK
jgi:hypothetical protein